jgi:hypothetical protein
MMMFPVDWVDGIKVPMDRWSPLQELKNTKEVGVLCQAKSVSPWIIFLDTKSQAGYGLCFYQSKRGEITRKGSKDDYIAQSTQR